MVKVTAEWVNRPYYDLDNLYQATDAGLDDIAGISPTDGMFIVGDGTNWVGESGATARASLGLGTAATQNYTASSWTPAITFAGGTTGITYSTQSGTYTQIGDTVHAFGRITLSNKGSSTGQMTIAGLPVAVASTGGADVGFYSGFSSLTGAPLILVDSNAAGPRVYEPGATGSSAVTDAKVTNAMDLRFSLTYKV